MWTRLYLATDLALLYEYSTVLERMLGQTSSIICFRLISFPKISGGGGNLVGVPEVCQPVFSRSLVPGRPLPTRFPGLFAFKVQYEYKFFFEFRAGIRVSGLIMKMPDEG